jgi:lipoprotein signal peptidase
MRPSYLPLLWTLALGGFALDQTCKYAVFTSLQSAAGHRREVIPEAFELLAVRAPSDICQSAAQLSNYEAFVSTHDWGRWIDPGRVAIGVVICLTIIVWGAHGAAAGDRKLCIALGLILAGTLGNLYDRVLLGGVRDFLHCHFAAGGLVFNVADCCLALGGAQMILYLLGAQPTGDLTSTDQSSVGSLREEPSKLPGGTVMIALDPQFDQSNVARV